MRRRSWTEKRGRADYSSDELIDPSSLVGGCTAVGVGWRAFSSFSSNRESRLGRERDDNTGGRIFHEILPFISIPHIPDNLHNSGKPFRSKQEEEIPKTHTLADEKSIIHVFS